MITALKIIGILAIVVVVIAAAAAFWFIRMVRKFIKAELESPGAPPCRVNPEVESSPAWRSLGIVNGFADEFRAAGFEEISAYSIPEMGGLQMLALVNLKERLYGVIYDHKQIEPTFDVVCEFEDETGVSATNSDLGKPLDQRPDHKSLWLGKVSVAQAVKAVNEQQAGAPRKIVSAASFLADFKKGYAKSMNWRMKKGGVSREEIKRTAEAGGNKLTDEQLDESYRDLRENYLRELQAGCIAQYLDEQKPAASEWEKIRECAFAVPETMDVKEVSEAIAGMVTLDEEQRHALDKLEKTFGETGVDVTRKIVARNIASLGLETLGEVREPVPALILKAPASA